MKNTFADLNNHLFAQLERLVDEGITEEKLKIELIRAKAVTDVSKNIIEAGKTVVAAAKVQNEGGMHRGSDPLTALTKSTTPAIESK